MKIFVAYTSLIECQGGVVSLRWIRRILQDEIGHSRSGCWAIIGSQHKQGSSWTILLVDHFLFEMRIVGFIAIFGLV